MRHCFLSFCLALGLLAYSPLFGATRLTVWGNTVQYGQTNVPADLTNAIAVAAGDYHVVALRADGTVTAWGGNNYGQTSVPPTATNVVAISAGSTHSLALRGDGSVVFWGNIYTTGVTNPPLESRVNTAVIAKGPTAQHVLQIRPGGTPVEWGNSGYGLLPVPTSATNLASVGIGSFYSVGVRSNGTLVAWGSGAFGIPMPAPPTGNVFVAVSAGYSHAIALRADGKVAAWGDSSAGGAATVPNTLSNVVAVASGLYHNLALTSDGKVTAWGLAAWPETIVPAGLSNVVAVAGGLDTSYALSADGGPPLLGQPLVTAGRIGGTAVLAIPVISTTPVSYQWTFAGTNLPGATNASLLIGNLQTNNAGAYGVVVSNPYGSVTNNDFNLQVYPILILAQPQAQTGLVNNSASFSVTASGAGTLYYQWKFNGTNLLGRTTRALTLSGLRFSDAGWYSVVVSNSFGTNLSDEAVLTVIASRVVSPVRNAWSFPGGTARFTFGLSASIPVTYQWQFNGVDIPGATTTSLYLTNVQPSSDGLYSIVWTDAYEQMTNSASLVVSQVAAWGDDGYGQIETPRGLSNIVQVAAGYYHSAALSRHGSVTEWGTGFPQPSMPPEATNVVAISAGDWGTLALRADGTVVARGGGLFGVLPDLTNIAAIAAGARHNLVLRSDGTVAAWGSNYYGETNTPAGLTNAVAVAAGDSVSLALTANGKVLAWGNSALGRTNVPTGLSNVVAIAAGYLSCIALTTDGKVQVWGDNSYGQTNVPPTATNIVAIGTGYGHCLALRDDGAALGWGYSTYGLTSIPLGLQNVTAISAGSFHDLALVGNDPFPERVQVAPPVLTASGLEVRVPSRSGKVYRLEYRSSLDTGAWAALPLVGGTGKTVSLIDPQGAGAQQRFYRVRAW